MITGLRTICCLSALAACSTTFAAPNNMKDLKQSFEQPPDDSRILMRWWWFGPAVTKAELEREMVLMKEGGIGGFEIQPVYALELDDATKGFRNLPYLSDEFLDNLRFVGEKANELGLRMDLTLGSGWPFGGPHIPITQAAGRLRVVRTAIPANGDTEIPALEEGEKLIAGIPQGATMVYFIASRTRQMVKRAAVGAEGYVLDHYSLPALENHLRNVGEPMLKALAKNPPYAIFSDSLEVYGSDWSDDFLEEFQKRRGYDLKPHLLALVDDIGEKTAAIRHDWGLTLNELTEERYLAPLTKWAAEHNTRFRSQTYGIPPVTLSSGSLVDLAEGEGWRWRQFSTSRWAASTNHLYNKPITSSETWTWLHSPAFRATPLDMKAEADLHFLQGINQLIGHGWPYSPPEAGEPGWRFYAAAVFNQHNPWWIVMPDLSVYLQRVSFMLRQGEPANDVAIYLPTHDAFAKFTLGNASVNKLLGELIGPNVIPQILDAGYNFDFIDDAALKQGKMLYRIIILPGVERIPVNTMGVLNLCASRGNVHVIATRRAPSRAPGLKEHETDTPKFALMGTFQVLPDEKKLGESLRAVIAPDVSTATEIGFVHRKLDDADIYFLANTSNRSLSAKATFRTEYPHASWWDPFTGKISLAEGKEVTLDLAPYESRILVFTREAIASKPVPTETVSEQVIADLSEDWKLTFAGSEQSMEMRDLHSWTEMPGREYFSGTVTYEKTFTFNADSSKDWEVYLNFGVGTPQTPQELGSRFRAWLEPPVREAAVVYVNNERAGSVWCPPYEVNVTGLLHEGENILRIIVANTAINLLAKGPLPDYKELTAKYGEKFKAQDMDNLQPLPSGLLGTIQLVKR